MEKRVDRNKEIYKKIQDAINNGTMKEVKKLNSASKKMQQIDPDFFGGENSQNSEVSKPNSHKKQIIITASIFVVIIIIIIIIGVVIANGK